MNPTERFCQLLRSRSEENKKSFAVLFQNKLYGNCFSVLRQELDSMVRVIYLLNETDLNKRESFIRQTLDGAKWSFVNHNGKKQKVTDRDMVELSDSLNGWTQNVYKFGCAFIHLSNFHDYQSEDPFQSLEDFDKDSIINQLINYHGANLNKKSTLNDLIRFLPSVMNKISSNYECEIKSLEEQKIKSV
ncbi:hypothetical protein [Kordia jejudonensis]|uniref:hypothetical protein n=1 Tax=Kordia jejudonensis TaxID=1348245 RepID=UPI0006299894|nr:hypothetical protein [Kordia jejudonensis]